jgi:hypothetical protein
LPGVSSRLLKKKNTGNTDGRLLPLSFAAPPLNKAKVGKGRLEAATVAWDRNDPRGKPVAFVQL